MGGRINLKFVRPEHSNRINCLLGTNRGKRDENTPPRTCQRDCVEGFFLTRVVMSEWLHPPQEGRYPQEGSILLCYKWHRGVLRHSGQPSTSR